MCNIIIILYQQHFTATEKVFLQVKEMFIKNLTNMNKVPWFILSCFPKFNVPGLALHQGLLLSLIHSGAPNENIVQNHINIALFNVL